MTMRILCLASCLLWLAACHSPSGRQAEPADNYPFLYEELETRTYVQEKDSLFLTSDLAAALDTIDWKATDKHGNPFPQIRLHINNKTCETLIIGKQELYRKTEQGWERLPCSVGSTDFKPLIQPPGNPWSGTGFSFPLNGYSLTAGTYKMRNEMRYWEKKNAQGYWVETCFRLRCP